MTSSCRLLLRSATVALLLCVRKWLTSGHTLRVRVQPGGGVGGEPFLEQPQVEILEGDSGDIDAAFDVSVGHSCNSSAESYGMFSTPDCTTVGSRASIRSCSSLVSHSSLHNVLEIPLKRNHDGSMLRPKLHQSQQDARTMRTTHHHASARC